MKSARMIRIDSHSREEEIRAVQWALRFQIIPTETLRTPLGNLKAISTLRIPVPRVRRYETGISSSRAQRGLKKIYSLSDLL